ncbi:leucyl aminopeptidase [Anianabacter salinae]|uniref:leucyl aminopeptidase n=1 Tax=Anianabacter salinae TaxID=2851023 RepID=UPI00225E644A|nr:leucyl aminopeptidase [Anianabacter salinae]MBV0914049.1 leucyl aminopeptidase [Anianabacter salinae]
MTTPAPATLTETDLDAIAAFEGRVAIFVEEDGRLDPAGRRVNRLTRGALERMAASGRFTEMKQGDAAEIAYPSGMAAHGVVVVKLDRRAGDEAARKAGVALGRIKAGKPLLILGGNRKHAAGVLLGATLRAYAYSDQKTKAADPEAPITLMVGAPDDHRAAVDAVFALAEGVFFTRDLVSAPANVLTTTEFAARLEALRGIGLEVEVLDEDRLEELGMRLLLAVGQGSRAPTKMVVMRWMGGGDEAPVALVGKGVVFDTGGISIKPAAGMEDMTMDMGGAGVVSGVMKTLALRKAKANVVGLVGLVENMPDGNAIRPGDVVASMKGDTVEIINTDAEGRLVLADVMWYAQETYQPRAMVDLATLTGAIIIGLGHEKAGVFSNDDTLSGQVLKAAGAVGEGAWRMPLDPAYDAQLKSDIADMKNVGGRPAGSITAAQFLQRFVKDGTPWVHLDIAGVASTKSESAHAPKGASGWGVLTLDRLIRDGFEG